jgi:O-acetyl-ADP-ribose deacetylase (regulator of RNase III)
VYGYPFELATAIATREVAAAAADSPTLERVVFACFGDKPLAHYRQALADYEPRS